MIRPATGTTGPKPNVGLCLAAQLFFPAVVVPLRLSLSVGHRLKLSTRRIIHRRIIRRLCRPCLGPAVSDNPDRLRVGERHRLHERPRNFGNTSRRRAPPVGQQAQAPRLVPVPPGVRSSRGSPPEPLVLVADLLVLPEHVGSVRRSVPGALCHCHAQNARACWLRLGFRCAFSTCFFYGRRRRGCSFRKGFR